MKCRPSLSSKDQAYYVYGSLRAIIPYIYLEGGNYGSYMYTPFASMGFKMLVLNRTLKLHNVTMTSFAVGEHDGMFHNKRFFKCPDKHGVIVPLEAVHLLMPSDVCLSPTVAKL